MTIALPIAFIPTAVLSAPVVANFNALKPTAVLLLPKLSRKALAPIAVFCEPSMLVPRAVSPTATFKVPVVLL